MGTPVILQARGRLIASDRLIGTWKGTFPVTIKHKQSIPLPVRDLRELQQSEVGEGEAPFGLLLVMKLMHGLKLETIEEVHEVITWPFARKAEKTREAVSSAGSRAKSSTILFISRRGLY